MKPRPLSKTNPYLKSPSSRLKLITRSVKTSGGVEGIKLTKPSRAAHIEVPRTRSDIAKQRLIARVIKTAKNDALNSKKQHQKISSTSKVRFKKK